MGVIVDFMHVSLVSLFLVCSTILIKHLIYHSFYVSLPHVCMYFHYCGYRISAGSFTCLLGRVTIRLFFEMDGLTYFELNLN